MFKRIFITVGTTKFDNLIKEVTEIPDIFKKIGCRQLVLQIGNGIMYEFDKNTFGGIDIEIYRILPSIREEIVSADLVISHAGAGTCIEVLDAQKTLIVVVNNLLMGNHQTELAERLSNDNYLCWCTPKDLIECLSKLDPCLLQPYVKGNVSPLVKYLDSLMGF